MTRIHDINTALRTLDAADHHADPTSARARTDLQSILATDPSPDPLQQPWSPSADRIGRPRNAARTTRRVGLAGGMLAAVTAGFVALPALTGGDQAFASWTRAPHGLTEQERADAAAGCRTRSWPTSPSRLRPWPPSSASSNVWCRLRVARAESA